MRSFYLKNKRGGFITLVSVLIIGLISLLVVSSVLLLSTDFARDNASIAESNQAKAVANACAESALDKLRKDSNYAGNEAFALNGGTCQIAALQGSGAVKTIQVTGLYGYSTRNVKVVTSQLKPQILISAWEEIPDLTVPTPSGA